MISACLLASACSSSSPASSGSDAVSLDDAGQDSTDQDDTATQASPIDVEVVSLGLYEGNAIVGELVMQTSEPTELVVSLSGPGDPSPIRSPEATNHRIAVFGLRENSTYQLIVQTADAASDDTSATATLTTQELPDEFPDLEADVIDASKIADGLTLLNLLYIPGLAGDDAIDFDQVGWLFMVDTQGEIVWYHRAERPIGDARALDDGTLLYEYDDMAARQINLFGEIVQEWAGQLVTGRLATDDRGRTIVSDAAIDVAVDSMHHEHAVLPDGNHATLSTELRVVDGYTSPQCGEDDADFDGTYSLIGDVVAVFDPATGTLVSEFSLFDYIDPRAPEHASTLCGLTQPFVFPNWMYQPVDPAARDWTHANGIAYDPTRNALIVSARHQHLLLAIRASDDTNGSKGDMLWSMGENGNLDLSGSGGDGDGDGDGGEWHYMQHAPEVQADGSILLFDNGANRPGYATVFTPDLPNPFSRAVQYVIDDEAMTATQVWEYRTELEDTVVYSSIVSDADRLDNGNVLITNGALFDVPEGYSAHLVEVVPSGPDDGTPVWQLKVLGGSGWIVYRAERISIFS